MRTILHIAPCPFPAPRGSQVFVSKSASGQAALGHRVAVACYANGEGDDPPGIEVVRARKIPFAFGGSGPHPTKPVANVALARAVRRWCTDNHPDLICAHNVEGPLVARLAGVRAPVFWEMHTRMAIELPWFLPGTAKVGARLDALALRSSDVAIALSEVGYAWLQAVEAPSRRLFPGIDTADVEVANRSRGRQRWELDERPWVVYAGNSDAYQELGVLVDAVARCPSVGLLLVTSGAQAWERKAHELGIGSERLRCVDSTAFEDHLDALAAGDIAGLPRGTCPGFPMKILNHAALALPTVSAGESAQPMPGVVAVAAGDVDAFASVLTDLAANPTRRRELGQEALEYARQATWVRRAQAVDEMLDTYLDGGLRKPG